MFSLAHALSQTGTRRRRWRPCSSSRYPTALCAAALMLRSKPAARQRPLSRTRRTAMLGGTSSRQPSAALAVSTCSFAAGQPRLPPSRPQVNNAAAFWFGPLEKVTEEDWMRMLKTNVIGWGTPPVATAHRLRVLQHHPGGTAALSRARQGRRCQCRLRQLVSAWGMPLVALTRCRRGAAGDVCVQRNQGRRAAADPVSGA